jgi:hypothetical protein
VRNVVESRVRETAPGRRARPWPTAACSPVVRPPLARPIPGRQLVPGTATSVPCATTSPVVQPPLARPIPGRQLVPGTATLVPCAATSEVLRLRARHFPYRRSAANDITLKMRVILSGAPVW